MRLTLLNAKAIHAPDPWMPPVLPWISVLTVDGSYAWQLQYRVSDYAFDKLWDCITHLPAWKTHDMGRLCAQFQQSLIAFAISNALFPMRNFGEYWWSAGFPAFPGQHK